LSESGRMTTIWSDHVLVQVFGVEIQEKHLACVVSEPALGQRHPLGAVDIVALAVAVVETVGKTVAETVAEAEIETEAGAEADVDIVAVRPPQLRKHSR